MWGATMLTAPTTRPTSRAIRLLGLVAKLALAFVAVALVARFCWLAVRTLTSTSEGLATPVVEQPRLSRLQQTIAPMVQGERERVEEEFRLTNSTSQSLTVVSIRSSCGCSDSRLDREVIEPGETATLKLSIRTAGRMGAFGVVSMVDTQQGYAWECVVKLTIDPLEAPRGSGDK